MDQATLTPILEQIIAWFTHLAAALWDLLKEFLAWIFAQIADAIRPDAAAPAADLTDSAAS